MTDDEIRAFVVLCDAATAGPWTVHDDPGCGEQCDCGEECWRTEYAVLRGVGGGVATALVGDRDAANARLIASARTVAPALAAEVLRLREALRMCQWADEGCCPDCGARCLSGAHAAGCAIGAALAGVA